MSVSSSQDSRTAELIKTRCLIKAARNGHNRVVSELLFRNVNVNSRNSFGDTALMMAARLGHQEVVRTLLINNADVNIKDRKGVTALTLAATYGYNGIVTMLLRHNADVSTLDLHIGCNALLKLQTWAKSV